MLADRCGRGEPTKAGRSIWMSVMGVCAPIPSPSCGVAAVMASDRARMPAAGIRMQACGDAHLANFGSYATPEGLPVFDISGAAQASGSPAGRVAGRGRGGVSSTVRTVATASWRVAKTWSAPATAVMP